MKITYTAFDGQTFIDKEACLSYEKALIDRPYGWAMDGQILLTDTNEITTQGSIVYLPTEEACKTFVQACIKNKTWFTGIEEDTPGLFMWHEGLDEFVYIDPDSLQPAFDFIKEMKAVQKTH